MANSLALIDEVKSVLKQRGLTYKMLAKKLSLSEASVKRIFSKYQCSLERLDEICEALEMDITDLLHLVNLKQKSISHLSEDQEKELVANPKLLLVAVCARSHWTFNQIVKNYEISETECIRLLAHLDRIHFLELLPNNRIKLLVASDFRWLPNGPVYNYYAKHVEQDYFNYKFSEKYEQRILITAGLSEQSKIILAKKIEALVVEFQELRKNDFSVPLEDREYCGMVVAFRPWQLKEFRELMRI